MKLFRRLLFCLAIMAAALPCARAQTNSSLSGDDLAAVLQLIEQVPPIPADSMPRNGTFWSAQHAPGTRLPWPPLPINIHGFDAWSLGDGVYLLNDTNVDYDALAAEYAAAHPAPSAPMMRFSMLASSLSTAAAYSHPVYLTNFTLAGPGTATPTASFGITGGTNFVPYDILATTNLLNPISAWNWLGIGYTSNNYTYYSQPTNQAFYILAKPSKTMTVGFGGDTVGQCDVPYGLTNALQVAAGFAHSLALLNNGTVVAWGWNGYGQTNVPADLTGVAMVAAGWYHSVALLTNGSVVAWGWDDPVLGYTMTNVPSNLTNATVISAQALHSLALTGNGLPVAWGYGEDGEASVPAGLSNVVAIAAGFQFNLVVTTNGGGTVVAWGDNAYGQTNLPAGLSNVVDVAAGPYHGMALLANGTVATWGSDDNGETNVPAGLTNVVAIAAGGSIDDSGYPDDYAAYSMALIKDGTVVVWGADDAVVPMFGLTNVVAIAAGGNHALAVRTGPRTPVITLEPTDQYQITNGTVTFSARGAGLYGVTYLWQTNGVNLAGATNATLTLTNVQAAQEVAYDVIVTDNAGMGSLTSSNANFHLVTPPVILSATQPTNQAVLYQTSLGLNVSASAPYQTDGFPLHYQWQLNGTNVAGATSSNYTFIVTNSGTYSLIVSNAAGSVTNVWQVTPVIPGSAWEWGNNEYGQTTVPSGLTNIAAIAAGDYDTVAVLDNGSVIQWGYTWASVPADLTNAVAVATGYDQGLAVRSDGTVEAWGYTNSLAVVQTNLSGVKAVACGYEYNVALLTNGTVVAWGFDDDDAGYYTTDVPPGLTNVTAIATQDFHTLALKGDGTVVAWGYDSAGETEVPAGLSNVVAVAAGEQHSLALLRNGTVVAWGLNDSGQTNVPDGLTNVKAIAAGWNHSVALLNNGTVVSWGDNTYGQTNTTACSQVKLLAAGGNDTVASIFSPTVMYPVDVTKDLLLIYNTNSADSATVLNYYLANRPMVSGANVLGIGCPGIYITNAPGNVNFVGLTNVTDYETVSPADFTNQVLNPVQNWLAANPTIRPQYLVLMLDVPSRIYSSATNAVNVPFYPPSNPYGSVSFQLSTSVSDWQPFITHINMNGTNDCMAYINRLQHFGTNYSPGRLVISASAGGYGNMNWYFDDTSIIGVSPNVSVLNASNGVVQAGLSPVSVIYTNVMDHGLLDHITNGFNIAGYLSFGYHSSLGGQFPTNGYVQWSGNSGWWLIETVESFNGQRYEAPMSNYMLWFSSNAFGGTCYSNTPVGAVSYTDEPYENYINNAAIYFGFWAAGKNFAICAWSSRLTPEFQAVGDPFVSK